MAVRPRRCPSDPCDHCVGSPAPSWGRPSSDRGLILLFPQNSSPELCPALHQRPASATAIIISSSLAHHSFCTVFPSATHRPSGRKFPLLYPQLLPGNGLGTLRGAHGSFVLCEWHARLLLYKETADLVAVLYRDSKRH